MMPETRTVMDYRFWIRKYAGYYLFVLFFILGMKYHFSEASCESLRWILAPTCWWVRILSGIPFQWIPKIGYTSHSYRFIIAASCSGLQFMLISIAALNFSFLHRMKTKKRTCLWILSSIGFSYLFTIFINGLRILLSIYIPFFLFDPFALSRWITKERFHSILGIMVYFTSLFLLYQFADGYSLSLQNQHDADRTSPSVLPRFQEYRNFIMPLFWYFSIVLGIPVLNRAYRNDSRGFWEYEILILTVSLSLLLLFVFLHKMQKELKGKKSGGK